MFKTYQLLSLIGVAALTAAFVGCSKEPAPSAVVQEEVVQEVAVPELSPSDMSDAMAGLSDADRAAAMAQKICPVSGGALGDMGTPIKITVDGRDVFLCCKGCTEKMKADPDKYFAKLDAS